jgi:uncharacterized protein (UPF0333 family)
MLIMTISNWRGKLKVLLLVVLLLLVGGIVVSYLNMGGDSETGAVNDRDANGSMKVEAAPQADPQEVDGNWFGGFVETLKGYCQD